MDQHRLLHSRQEGLRKSCAARTLRNCDWLAPGILVVRATIEYPSVLCFPHAAPLLEEKRHVLLPAQQEFVAVSDPFPMHNSHGSLMFMLFFAAANEHSAKVGLKIANDIIGKFFK